MYPVEQFAEVALRSVRARIYGAQEKRDCSDDPVKTERIARTMLWDWLAAKRLVEGYGGRFVAALVAPEPQRPEDRVGRSTLT